ncbi:HNH endonuclease signature motif containing protein [Brachybacterium muris]|uniref:HNH endonuclease signature motif containing protein n=1 Tax=Brachybacterium muris TaxID=219301 RepID=UPI003B9697DE
MSLRTRKPTLLGDERLPVRFWEKVSLIESGCWEWTASLTAGGYGQYYPRKDQPRRAHRVAYEALVGAVPSGLQLDHLCRNRACCNPSHVEPVTSRENTMRGENFAAKHAAATHCPHGHPYSGDNLRIRPCGRRACRACHRRRAAERRARGRNS